MSMQLELGRLTDQAGQTRKPEAGYVLLYFVEKGTIVVETPAGERLRWPKPDSRYGAEGHHFPFTYLLVDETANEGRVEELFAMIATLCGFSLQRVHSPEQAFAYRLVG